MPETGPERTRRGPLAWLGQLLLYGAFAAFVGVFSSWPPYRHLGDGEALVKISFVHAGKPVADCVRPSAEELAKLPPNMRAPTRCPRERSPIVVAVDVDDRNVLTAEAPPSGLSKDGASAIFRRLVVPAGERHVRVRISDDVRRREAPYQREDTRSLAPGEVLVIGFDPGKGGIDLQ
jgi:hypothetical protein